MSEQPKPKPPHDEARSAGALGNGQPSAHADAPGDGEGKKKSARPTGDGQEPAATAVPPQGDGAAEAEQAHPAGGEVEAFEPEAPEPEAHEPEAPEPERLPEPTFYIVGIGASAGGLEALGELVRHVPFDTMAFVIVQHLAPQHESVLTTILARTSNVEVITAADGMPVEPNHVYVIPPNANLAVMHGVLHLLTPPNGYSPRLAIDFFFRSLADDLGPSAIGVILSGTGTDGTFGLKAIKAAGGITFVQEPSTAKYDGMPRSALATGAADFCLPIAEIGKELTRISRQTRAQAVPRNKAPAPEVQEQIAKLFVLIRAEFGNDLTHYKPATVERRIERRMVLHKIGELASYVKYVQANPDELRALYSDMLITVTSFFRDPEVFDVVQHKLLAELLQNKETSAPLRIWVPACATGEEAYSLAICVLELLDGRSHATKIQIFATDVDDEAVQHARRGVYALNIASDVSPERLNRFFTKKSGEYTVSRQVRDMVVFSQQNVLKDAPFSRIDLVSCRNLLIYLKPAAQKRVLRIVHYALQPQGYLLLGTSETVSDAPELFDILDRKHKIYARKNVTAGAALEVGFNVPGSNEIPAPPPGARPLMSLQALADRKVLDLYGPPGVVINEHMEILHFRGRTGPYLDPAPGVASFNILRLARPELHMELKRAVQEALAKQLRVSVETTLREEGRAAGSIRLDVVPIQEPESRIRCLLILFHKLPPPREIPVPIAGPGQAGEALGPLAERIRELEHELVLTKEYLQTTIEEKESANEELKSANEELQSSNEELQSTNEELETSKEEMQSSNEELTTVNEELQNRMEELGVANDDLHNVLASVDNAVIIIGMDLRIRRYTVAAEKLLNLVPGDLGRSVSFLDDFVGDTEIAARVSSVISTLSASEQEILAKNHRYYNLRVTPYKTLDHAIRGAIVSLIDIDVWKRTADLTRDTAAYADGFLSVIGHPLLIVDGNLRVVWANKAFYGAFDLSADETIGNLFPNIAQRTWADSNLRGLLEAAVSPGKTFWSLPIKRSLPGGGEKTMRIGAARIPTVTDAVMVLVSIDEEPDPYERK